MKCIQCNKEFEAKRVDAKYCSSGCRVKHLRGVTDNFVTDNVIDNVTDKSGLKTPPPIPEDVMERINKEREAGYGALADNLIEQWNSIWILENHDIKTLEENKVYIPNWRYKHDKYPR